MTRASLACACRSVNSSADLDEHIGGLRAQLLRSEQEKELMRGKLEEAVAAKEMVMKEVRAHRGAATGMALMTITL